MSLKKFTLCIPEDVNSWVESESKARGINRHQLIKLALRDFRLANDATPVAAKKRQRRTTADQQPYLEQVKKVFGPNLAADNCGLGPDQVDKWNKDQAFQRHLEFAQAVYLESLEQEMVAVGRGEKKGVFGALKACLEARLEDYGRLRMELISRIAGNLIDKFHAAAAEVMTAEQAMAFRTRLQGVTDLELLRWSE